MAMKKTTISKTTMSLKNDEILRDNFFINRYQYVDIANWQIRAIEHNPSFQLDNFLINLHSDIPGELCIISDMKAFSFAINRFKETYISHYFYVKKNEDNTTSLNLRVYSYNRFDFCVMINEFINISKHQLPNLYVKIDELIMWKKPRKFA